MIVCSNSKGYDVNLSKKGQVLQYNPRKLVSGFIRNQDITSLKCVIVLLIRKLRFKILNSLRWVVNSLIFLIFPKPIISVPNLEFLPHLLPRIQLEKNI